MTFDATVNPVAYEGGEAVFIDIEYDTWNRGDGQDELESFSEILRDIMARLEDEVVVSFLQI